MFTGLIEATGQMLAVRTGAGLARIQVAGPAAMVARLRTGDSIAVSGVCLTALNIDTEKNCFHADLAAATVERTSLTHLQAGSVVNLELPTPAGTPLGGHIVQGHVDGTGQLLSLEPTVAGNATGDWWMTISLPEDCARYVVSKGSITVEGISLTVADFDGATVAVNIIPHTYAATNLHTLQPGSPVNIEVDVLAKYAERLGLEAAQIASKPAHTLTLESLIANGY
jgi:riboflavin synthase